MFGLFKTKAAAMTPDRAEKIINAFGGVISSNRATIADEGVLPHSKAEIKEAIRFCLRLTDDPQTVEQLKVGYVLLSDFMPLTAQEKAVVARHAEWMQTLPDMSDPEAMQSMVSVFDQYQKLTQRVAEEAALLSTEINAIAR